MYLILYHIKQCIFCQFHSDPNTASPTIPTVITMTKAKNATIFHLISAKSNRPSEKVTSEPSFFGTTTMITTSMITTTGM